MRKILHTVFFWPRLASRAATQREKYMLYYQGLIKIKTAVPGDMAHWHALCFQYAVKRARDHPGQAVFLDAVEHFHKRTGD